MADKRTEENFGYGCVGCLASIAVILGLCVLIKWLWHQLLA